MKNTILEKMRADIAKQVEETEKKLEDLKAVKMRLDIETETKGQGIAALIPDDLDKMLAEMEAEQ